MGVTTAPLIITEAVIKALGDLRTAAANAPVDVIALQSAIKTPEGERLHRQRMTAQTVTIPGPWPFFVAFSIETGHPVGPCRHMSMSAERAGRVPTEQAVWLVAKHLGFQGGIEACRGWPEKLSDGGVAVNIVQPLSVRVPDRD